MGTSYETDVVAWAMEQAALLRAREFSAIDIEHIAEEIEDVARSEQRELIDRIVKLQTKLLEWRFLPGRRCRSKKRIINAERLHIAYVLKDSQSLRAKIAAPDCVLLMWKKAVAEITNATGLDVFPEACPWSVEQALDDAFMPG